MRNSSWYWAIACLLGLNLGWAVAADELKDEPRGQRGRPGMEARTGREFGAARSAQARRGPLANLEEMLEQPDAAESLGLAPEQVAALKGGFQELATERHALMAALEAAGTEQARLMTADDLDETAVLQAVEDAGRVRTELAKLHARQLILARQVLTDEQMQRIRRQRQRQRIEQHRQGRPEARGERGQMQRPGPDQAEARRQAVRQKMQERRQQRREENDE